MKIFEYFHHRLSACLDPEPFIGILFRDNLVGKAELLAKKFHNCRAVRDVDQCGAIALQADDVRGRVNDIIGLNLFHDVVRFDVG